MDSITLPELALEGEGHRLVATTCFNHAWVLMGREDRTEEEDRLLLEVAQASRFHWRFVGGRVEQARAAWLLSRVHAVLGQPAAALREGRHCLELVERGGLGAFDRAFAFEAIARAGVLMQDPLGADEARAAGEAAAVEIEADAERDWVRRNLASLEVPPPG